MRISDWSSDGCSSDLRVRAVRSRIAPQRRVGTRHDLAGDIERRAALAPQRPDIGQFTEHRIEPEDKRRAQNEARDAILARHRAPPSHPYPARMPFGIIIEPPSLSGAPHPPTPPPT